MYFNFYFTSLLSISVGITSSATGLEISAIATRIRKYQSIIKKKKKKHDEIVFLAKTKWNSTEVLIYQALIDSIFLMIIFFLNNMFKQYDNMKKETKKFKT